MIGDPVGHSASPQLHRAFLAAAGVAGTYDAVRVCAGDAGAAIDCLRASGYTGLNVTTPLKEEAFARADTHDAASIVSGAANTLLLGARIEAYNTDGIGALAALGAAGLDDVAQARVLVLGAGPTARASVTALVSAGAAVTLWNRTAARADRVARELGVRPWRAGERADAVISALPPSTDFEDRALREALRAIPLVIDANYGARATLGATLARDDIHDGRAMLEASARASFALFLAESA